MTTLTQAERDAAILGLADAFDSAEVGLTVAARLCEEMGYHDRSARLSEMFEQLMDALPPDLHAQAAELVTAGMFGEDAA